MILALKVAGLPMGDEEVGQLTWDVWLGKREAAQTRSL